MKKSVLLALAALTLGGASAVAQEVTYEPDCSQGLLLNKNKDNWFLTVQGGTNIMFSQHDVDAKLKNRFGANAGLYVGKWINPIFGFRFGANWVMPRGVTEANNIYRKYIDGNPAGMQVGRDGKAIYEEKFMGLGPEFDVMINLTNWWCGYKPNRVYNAVLHGGAGAYWTWGRNYGGTKSTLGWHRSHNTWMFVNLGLQNNFRLSSVVDIFVDVQYEIFDIQPDAHHDVSASLGLNFNFGKSTWNCPVTAVCPTWKYTDAEGDALVAKLNAAENKINNLQSQLDAALRRPAQVKEADCEGLATVYYPINQYALSGREKTILKGVAAVMNEKPEQKYVITGYADNYTGTDEINARLRQQRVDGVKNYLVKCGVNADQLIVKTNDNNLTDLGIKAAPLDRAVTIRLAD